MYSGPHLLPKPKLFLKLVLYKVSNFKMISVPILTLKINSYFEEKRT